MHAVKPKAHHWSPKILAFWSTLALLSCGKESKLESTAPTSAPSAGTTVVIDASPIEPRPDAAAAMAHFEPVTISLVGETPVSIPSTGMRAHISGSFHKVRAPLVGVSVLIALDDAQAEVSWRIESGRIDSSWIPVRGRRYDNTTSKYVDEELPGWLVRLDSVEDYSAGGDPRAITISLQRDSGADATAP